MSLEGKLGDAERGARLIKAVNNSPLYPERIDKNTILYVRRLGQLPEMVVYEDEAIENPGMNDMVSVRAMHGTGDVEATQVWHLLTQAQFEQIQAEVGGN